MDRSSSMLHPPSAPPRPPLSSSSKQLQPPVNLDSYVTELGQWDVLLGRGTGPNEHRGNMYFRQVVKQQARAYFAATNRKEKAEIIKATINHITMKKKGRFLTKLGKQEILRLGISTSGGQAIYNLADSANQIDKTKQAFRYACKNGIKDNYEDIAVTHKNKNSRKYEEPDGSRGDTSCHPPPVQKKARKEAAAVSSTHSLSAAASPLAAASTSSLSLSSSASSSRAVSLCLPAPAASMYIRPGTPALDLVNLTKRNFGAATTSPTSCFLPWQRPQYQRMSQGFHPRNCAAVTTSPTSCFPLWQRQQQQQQQRMSQGFYPRSTRSFSFYSPVIWETVLVHRSLVDDIVNANSAEALLRGCTLEVPGAGALPPHQLSNFTPTTTTGTTTISTGSNTSTSDDPVARYYAGVLTELATTAADKDALHMSTNRSSDSQN